MPSELEAPEMNKLAWFFGESKCPRIARRKMKLVVDGTPAPRGLHIIEWLGSAMIMNVNLAVGGRNAF